MRLLGWAAVGGLLIAALAVPTAALSNDTAGNNGTVKIHEGPGENDPGEVRNEPHVCTFHLHFYFSDPEQAGTWEIQEWAPGDKGTVVLSGSYDTHGDGEDRQPEAGVYTLPDGHYKLFWDGDLDTDKHDKMKVFWVDCAAETESPSQPATEAPSQSVGGETEAPSEQPSQSVGAETESPSQPATEAPSQSVAAETETPSEQPSQSVAAESESPAISFGQSVGAETDVPGGGVTQPPTDMPAATAPSDAGWRTMLVMLAALLAALLVLTPAEPLIRRR